MTEPKLAVFIDCENANPNLAPALFRQWTHLAKANIKRGYGDPARLQGWSQHLKEYCFQPMQTAPFAKASNATDFALVIDCLDLLYARRFDEAWLITSDSDFALLATHLKAHGVRVIGVGEEKTPEVFRKACSKFLVWKPETKLTAPAKPKQRAGSGTQVSASA